MDPADSGGGGGLRALNGIEQDRGVVTLLQQTGPGGVIHMSVTGALSSAGPVLMVAEPGGVFDVAYRQGALLPLARAFWGWTRCEEGGNRCGRTYGHGGLRMRFRGEFRAAFGEALRSLSDKDRVILRHHLLDRLSIDRIGQLYDVHRSTAARWLANIREQIHERTQEEFRVRLGLEPADFESLMAMVLSQLSYSIGRELR